MGCGGGGGGGAGLDGVDEALWEEVVMVVRVGWTLLLDTVVRMEGSVVLELKEGVADVGDNDAEPYTSVVASVGSVALASTSVLDGAGDPVTEDQEPVELDTPRLALGYALLAVVSGESYMPGAELGETWLDDGVNEGRTTGTVLDGGSMILGEGASEALESDITTLALGA